MTHINFLSVQQVYFSEKTGETVFVEKLKSISGTPLGKVGITPLGKVGITTLGKVAILQK